MFRSIRQSLALLIVTSVTIPMTVAPSFAAVAGEWRAETEHPKDVIGTAVNTVADALTSKTLTLAEKRRQVEAIVKDNLDIHTLSKLVMARNWRKLDETQRSTFTKHFEQHLINTYWRNAEGATLERIEVRGDREENRGDWTVMTDIITSNDSLSIDYRLRKRVMQGETTETATPSERWLIIDIIIERVSLVSNFRSQFQEIVSGQGVDRLLELLEEKNETARSAREKDEAEEVARLGAEAAAREAMSGATPTGEAGVDDRDR